MNNFKVSAFLGSPRKGGNTELLFTETLKGVRKNTDDISIFNLNDMDIKGCQDCGDCENTGICTVLDDMEEIYEAIRESNRFIVASPVFFYGLSAQTKAMVDRCQAFWCEKYLLKKPLSQTPVVRKGLFLNVGGMKKETGYSCSEATINIFFKTISVNEHKSLVYKGYDEKGAILKNPDALKEAYEAGNNLAS